MQLCVVAVMVHVGSWAWPPTSINRDIDQINDRTKCRQIRADGEILAPGSITGIVNRPGGEGATASSGPFSVPSRGIYHGSFNQRARRFGSNLYNLYKGFSLKYFCRREKAMKVYTPF